MNIAAKSRAWLGKHLSTKTDYSVVPQNKARQTLVASTGVGIAAGAALGLGAGTLATALNSKTEVIAETDILEPTLVGHDHSYETECVYWDDEGCYEQDYHHQYQPEFSNKVVGQYEMPKFQDSLSLDPIRGAVVGAVGGGILGLGVGIALNVMNRAATKEDEPKRVGVELQSLKSMIDKDTSNVVKGAILGTGIGAGLGWGAGQLEAMKGAPVTRTYIGPVTESQFMGRIPADVTTGSWNNHLEATQTRGVHAQVPVYDDSGSPLLESKTESISGARFSPSASALVGGAVGLGAGIAGGVAYNVLQRVAAYEPME